MNYIKDGKVVDPVTESIKRIKPREAVITTVHDSVIIDDSYVNIDLTCKLLKGSSLLELCVALDKILPDFCSTYNVNASSASKGEHHVYSKESSYTGNTLGRKIERNGNL